MILSDRGRFIFIHNPKAGGMSMRTALKPWDDSEGFFDGWRPYPAEGRRLDRMHLTMAQLRRHHPKAFAKLESHWSFGFVRDPWQRLCSAFSQHLTLNSPQLRDSIRGDRDLFFAVLNRFVPRALTPEAVGGDVKLTHFIPQSAFFTLDGRQIAAEIARLEAPERWHPRIAELLGPGGPPRRNANPDKGAERYETERLNQAARDRVRAFYEEDFARFGFADLQPAG